MGMENVQRGRLQEVKDCVVSQSQPRERGGHLLKYKEDDTNTNESESDSCRVRMKTKEVHDPFQDVKYPVQLSAHSRRHTTV